MSIESASELLRYEVEEERRCYSPLSDSSFDLPLFVGDSVDDNSARLLFVNFL